MPKKLSARKYGTWRKRALAAEGRADALEELLLTKTGHSSAFWMMIDTGISIGSRPGFAITNLRLPEGQ